MKEFFVNLKRFEVSKKKGGICPIDDPLEWIESIIHESIELALGDMEDSLTFLLPEALILPAIKKLKEYPPSKVRSLHIGCQGVFRDDIEGGKNFGAFTSHLPATAASHLGCTCSIIGHSEERRGLWGVLEAYRGDICTRIDLKSKADQAIHRILNQEILLALRAGLKALYCVGETEEEKGTGDLEEQQRRIKLVLERQLLEGLRGIKGKHLEELVIGYEPIWAIGPLKIPPDAPYISFVSSYIKGVVEDEFGFVPKVVYGGGLKEENAFMMGGIDTIDGGLVALTRFTREIGFYTKDLKEIIAKYKGVSEKIDNWSSRDIFTFQ